MILLSFLFSCTHSDFKDILNEAQVGDAEAQRIIAYRYSSGEGGAPKDFVKSDKWYKLSAEQGNLRAQLNLGYNYYIGRGVSQNYDEAIKWYRLAANQGNSSGQVFLGHFYAGGLGVTKDGFEAINWYKLAAENKNRAALLSLGNMYAHGSGIPKDVVHAYMWFIIYSPRSRDRSHSGILWKVITDDTKLLLDQMTNEQIEEAKKLAHAWLIEHW